MIMYVEPQQNTVAIEQITPKILDPEKSRV